MSIHRREALLKFGPVPEVTFTALYRYLELVERTPVGRRALTDLERIRTTPKVREIVYRGRELSVRECAIFLKAAANVVSSRSRGSSAPFHWGSYYYLENRNAIAVVNHDLVIMTVIMPNDVQLQHLERMKAEVSGVRQRSEIQAILRDQRGAEFEICIGDGKTPTQEQVGPWIKNHDADTTAVWMDADNKSAYTCKSKIRDLPKLGDSLNDPSVNAIWLMREIMDKDLIVPRRVVCSPQWAMFMLLSLIGRDAMVPSEGIRFDPGTVYALSLSDGRASLERVYRL